MISLWHLLWIVPLSVIFGFITAALLCANQTRDVYVDSNFKRLEKEVDNPK